MEKERSANNQPAGWEFSRLSALVISGLILSNILLISAWYFGHKNTQDNPTKHDLIAAYDIQPVRKRIQMDIASSEVSFRNLFRNARAKFESVVRDSNVDYDSATTQLICDELNISVDGYQRVLDEKKIVDEEFTFEHERLLKLRDVCLYFLDWAQLTKEDESILLFIGTDIIGGPASEEFSKYGEDVQSIILAQDNKILKELYLGILDSKQEKINKLTQKIEIMEGLDQALNHVGLIVGIITFALTSFQTVRMWQRAGSARASA